MFHPGTNRCLTWCPCPWIPIEGRRRTCFPTIRAVTVSHNRSGGALPRRIEGQGAAHRKLEDQTRADGFAQPQHTAQRGNDGHAELYRRRRGGAQATQRGVPRVYISAAPGMGGARRPGNSRPPRPPKAKSHPPIYLAANRSPRHIPHEIMVACTAPNGISAPVAVVWLT